MLCYKAYTLAFILQSMYSYYCFIFQQKEADVTSLSEQLGVLKAKHLQGESHANIEIRRLQRELETGQYKHTQQVSNSHRSTAQKKQRDFVNQFRNLHFNCCSSLPVYICYWPQSAFALCLIL